MLDPEPSPSEGVSSDAVARRHPLSVRLTVHEYDALCIRALREERTVTYLVRRAVRHLLKSAGN